MIKYSSKDIIKRAEQLADLENSDFISDYEKLALLNENWTILYQKIINSGDKTFIKKIHVQNGTRLPADFYQMSDIYTYQTHNPITRKNAEQYDGYDIIDGKISLSRSYDNVDVIVEYYPAPKTLYLKSKTKDSDYETNTVACNGSLYYTEDGLIKDIYDPDIRTEVQFSDDNVAMFNNAAFVYDYENSKITSIFTYGTSTLSNLTEEDNTGIPFIIDNEMYLMHKETYEIYDAYGNKYDTLSITFETMPEYIYANKGYDTMYAVYSDHVEYYNRLELVASYNCDHFRGKAVLNGKALYAVTQGNKLVKLLNKVDVLETKYVPVTIIDENSVMTHKPLADRYFVEGIVPDTVLDFSNNIFYILISYLLAIAFKSKQGADTTLLAGQLSVAEQQFQDSINKDINGQYTVKNVYKDRRYF